MYIAILFGLYYIVDNNLFEYYSEYHMLQVINTKILHFSHIIFINLSKEVIHSG